MKPASCQLINPLCPDDLCVLPFGHKGWHQLGTMSEPMKLSRLHRLAVPRQNGVPYQDFELIQMGWELQEQLIRQGKMLP